jgi:hypothetical protein
LNNSEVTKSVIDIIGLITCYGDAFVANPSFASVQSEILKGKRLFGCSKRRCRVMPGTGLAECCYLTGPEQGAAAEF